MGSKAKTKKRMWRVRKSLTHGFWNLEHKPITHTSGMWVIVSYSDNDTVLRAIARALNDSKISFNWVE